MNCQDFEKSVLALARNQLLDAAVRVEGLAHKEVCERCATRLAEERALLDGVRLVVAEIAHEEAPARIETALLAAFRAQAKCKDAPHVRLLPERGRRRQWLTWAACAAVILLAILTGVMRLKPSPTEQKQAVRRQPASPANPAPQKEMLVANGTEPKPSVAAPQSKTRRGRRQATVRESEMATQFYPLAEEGELTPLESGRVVRVEVPASTLISFGLSVTSEALAQPVQADLLLGQDGLARAIRFLPTTKTQ